MDRCHTVKVIINLLSFVQTPVLVLEEEPQLDFQVENQPRAAFVPIYQYPSQKMSQLEILLQNFFCRGGTQTMSEIP